MKIKLQGIGIIKNSEIELDGLTVITGDNNSGKTTVGKVVYSLFDSVSNLTKRAQTDKNTYARRILIDVVNELKFLSICVDVKSQNDFEIFYLFDNPYFIRSLEAIPTARRLLDWLLDFRKNRIEKLNDNEKKVLFDAFNARFFVKPNDNLSFEDALENLLEKPINSLTKLLENLKSDPLLINYARASISQTLKVEFSEQIQPVTGDIEKSSIVVSDYDNIYFNINIVDNEIVNNGESVYFDSAFNSVFFVDDPFILDEDYAQLSGLKNKNNNNDDENFLNKRRIRRHGVKLRYFLKTPTNNIFEQNILEEQNSGIMAKINEVISGEFDFSGDDDYYINKGRKLRFSNLATGSKLFSILKILVSKGALTDSTILILDEPEAHLHPAWQNKFAEVIVMLVKELGVKVLLTSHSSNFVLAIDAFMRKYEIKNKTHFYQTGFTDDGFARYDIVDDDMGKIYSDFVQYLTEVKLLRDKYMYGSGEDDDQ